MCSHPSVLRWWVPTYRLTSGWPWRSLWRSWGCSIHTVCSHPNVHPAPSVHRRWYAPSPRHLRSLLSEGYVFLVSSFVVILDTLVVSLCVCPVSLLTPSHHTFTPLCSQVVGADVSFGVWVWMAVALVQWRCWGRCRAGFSFWSE